MDDYLESVIGLIAEQTGTNGDYMDEDSDLIMDVGMDSLDTPELMLTIEDEYDIEIDDSDIERIHTIGDICSMIQEKADAAKALSAYAYPVEIPDNNPLL